jgi:small conductance mechanosensitive channel
MGVNRQFMGFRVTGLRAWRYLGLSLIILGLTWLLSGFSIVALAQVPSLPSAFSKSQSLTSAGVERYGQIEVAWVLSPLDNKQLFQIASPTVFDRSAIDQNALPVEVRAQEIRERLKRSLIRFYSTDDRLADQSSPTVIIGRLNQRPILLLSDGKSRPLRLVKITDEDSEFYGQQPEELAADLQGILQEEVNRLIEVFSWRSLQRRIFRSAGVLLVLLTLSGLGHLLRRAVNARQQRLRAQYEDTLQAVTPPGAEMGDSRSLLPQVRGLSYRIGFYTLIKWLVFWLLIVSWYVGVAAIVNQIPILMRYTSWILATPLELLVLWFLISLAIRIGRSLIQGFIQTWEYSDYLHFGEEQRRSLRARTLSSALKGLFTGILLVIGLIGALSILKIPTRPVLAGSAIIGLAISFGSQNLIKDLVNGCLILLEDQFAIGDVIDLGRFSGVVEDLNLRVTQLRNGEGRLIIIPNSAITEVQNLTRLWSQVDFSIEVAYENDPVQVFAVMHKIAQSLYDDPPWRDVLPSPPQVLGLENLSPTGMEVRVLLRTLPGKQWVVGREFRLRVRQGLEQEGIELSKPRFICS